jgi:hypothetical protein
MSPEEKERVAREEAGARGAWGEMRPSTTKPVESKSVKSAKEVLDDIGMSKTLNSSPDRNESSTKEQDAQANREAAMSATDAAYQRLEASRQKRIEAEKISDAAFENLQMDDSARRAKIESEDKARRAMIEQVAEDRDTWFKDVRENVRASGIDPDTGKQGPFSNIKRAFTGVRKDAPMPQVDWDQFDSRSSNDPNFGRSRYESQYKKVEIPTQYGGKRTETQFTGEYVDPFKAKTPKGMRRTGAGYMPIDPAYNYAKESSPKVPSIL